MPAHLRIRQLQLTLSSSTFDSGVIGWLICSDTKCHVLHTGKCILLNVKVTKAY